MNPLTGTLGLVLFVFLFVLVLLWFLLPFALFGTKPRLDRLIELAEQNNVLLKELVAELRAYAQGQTRDAAPGPERGRHIQFRE